MSLGHVTREQHHQLTAAQQFVRDSMEHLWAAGRYELHAAAAELAGRIGLEIAPPVRIVRRGVEGGRAVKPGNCGR